MLQSISTFFDAHCHLDPAASGGSAGRRRLAGRILCGVSPADWPRLRDAAADWPGTIAAYGLHPWHISDAGPGWLETLEEFLLADPGAWLGEAGLDGLKTDSSPADRQMDYFADQLRLAARLGRRLNLHCVKAWDALVDALDKWYLPGGGRRFVVHSFGGPHQYIKPLSERGAWFTVGPLAWGNGSERSKRRIAALPPDRLLTESDAFLAPGVDDAESVAATAEWLAGVCGVTVGDMAARLRDNIRRLTADG